MLRGAGGTESGVQTVPESQPGAHGWFLSLSHGSTWMVMIFRSRASRTLASTSASARTMSDHVGACVFPIWPPQFKRQASTTATAIIRLGRNTKTSSQVFDPPSLSNGVAVSVLYAIKLSYAYAPLTSVSKWIAIPEMALTSSRACRHHVKYQHISESSSSSPPHMFPSSSDNDL
ncbi:uncharacterized protein CLUP02_15859 [Colletotrichum lupini]|uniref:Uncharacterized protein n=1 Tax=Colletotrichum lupini TaxID=145971 RepID=A0A9Q8T6R1_9PEZI|nr:uncharacterized protein CLUP02_15859 [Colletotrichum lupini]UQC90329.1 hypothetical protein CLUP02_15859 [Colletotrichum lupini]